MRRNVKCQLRNYREEESCLNKVYCHVDGMRILVAILNFLIFFTPATRVASLKMKFEELNRIVRKIILQIQLENRRLSFRLTWQEVNLSTNE